MEALVLDTQLRLPGRRQPNRMSRNPLLQVLERRGEACSSGQSEVVPKANQRASGQ